jgi:hypothetical protein
MHSFPSIEPLESRIAPAVILTFSDHTDDDVVQLISDKPLTAVVRSSPNANPSEIQLTGAGLDGANLTTVVQRSANGDGLVNIGRIVATNLDLGAVTIAGDLGKIACGNPNNPLPGLGALYVRSMGAYGLATQGVGDLVSNIVGDVGAIEVAGDAVGARIVASGHVTKIKIGGDLRGNSSPNSGRLEAGSFTKIVIVGDLIAGSGDASGTIAVTGDLGKLTIRGSMYGATDATGDPLSGQIMVNGNAGPIFIVRDLFGAQREQKAIDIRGNAGAITIGGSIFAQAGKHSGSIFVEKNAGVVTIGRDLNGGSGELSGGIFIAGTVAGIDIGGDLRGGSGDYENALTFLQVSVRGSTGPVQIGGDIISGAGRGSGNVSLGSGATSFFLGGSLIGGGTEVANTSVFPGGVLTLGNVPLVTITGDIRESSFAGGSVHADTIGRLIVKGSIFAAAEFGTTTKGASVLDIGSVTKCRIEGNIVGSPDPTGLADTVRFRGSIGKLRVVGSIEGAAGSSSGSVLIEGDATSIRIDGSLRGGTGTDSGALTVDGRIELLDILGGVEGAGAAFTTGQVAAKSFGVVNVGGDLVGGPFQGGGTLRALTGGFDTIGIGGSLYAGNSGGSIVAATSLGDVAIAGSISGGFAMNHSSLAAVSARSITIGGDAFANGGGNNALINLQQSAGAIFIGGDLRGSAVEPAWLLFSSDAGYTTPGFTSLTIVGSVANALITGGYRADNSPQNGDATLGAVRVLGNWTASSLVAGVRPGGDLDFGSSDDTPIVSATPEVSRIAAIVIKGEVLGTLNTGDHFGFVAQSIGAVKIGGVAYTPSAGAPIELGRIFGDTTVRLV